MMCPYCLQNMSGTKCPNGDCLQEIPPLYLQHHSGIGRSGPAILSAVGFSGHGKTVYVASLLDTLERKLTQAWPKFYRQGLDTDTVRTVQTNIALLRRGELPESTRRNFPKPSIHRLNDMQAYGSRGLLIYDPPGEAFNSDADMGSYAHFVQRARVVLFLVSIPDLEEPKADDLYRLLNTYVLGMARMKAKTRNQHLVVAFTKSDRIADQLRPYPMVYNHLISTESDGVAQPKRYVEVLRGVSKDLHTFAQQTLGATSFIRLTQDQFKSVAYCAVSALGSAPEGGHLATAMEPRCVVDPLIWVLERS